MINHNLKKIFTYQTNEVIDIILNDGIYYPNFKYSNHRSDYKSYKFILDKYNKLNNSKYKGLIFGVGKMDNKIINTFEDYNDMMLEFSACGSFSDYPERDKVLELDLSKFNEKTIDIDFYRFTDLMYYMDVEPDEGIEEDIDIMKDDIFLPNCGDIFECLQTNISYISKDMIINIHDIIAP